MKYIVYFLLIIVSVVSVISPVSAQERMMIYPPTQPIDGSVLGQDQAYTLYLRGNGESIVNFRAVFTNNSDSEQKEIVFTFPQGAIVTEDLVAYQVIREPVCIQYETYSVTAGTSVDYASQPACLRYEEPMYYNIYGQNRYIKVIPTVTGNELRVPLTDAIAVGKAGSVLISFRTSAYITKTPFDAYTYAFETFKSTDQVQNLQIGVRLDPHLKIKRADGNISYTQVETLQGFDKSMSSVAPDGARNDRLDAFYTDIGYGVISETASYLQSGDTYTLTGEYADSLLKLYGQEIITGFLILIGLIVVMIIVVKSVMTQLRKRKAAATTADAKRSQARTEAVLTVGSIGFAAGLILALYSFGLYFYVTYVSSYWYGNLQGLVALFIAVLSVGLYPTVLFGPAVAIGIKRGWTWGLSTVIATLVWFVIIFFIGLVFILSYQQVQDQIKPMPMYDMGRAEPAVMESQP